MATLEQVRRIALALPGAQEGKPRFGFAVEKKGKLKGFAWSWKERIEPKKPRVENLDVLAVRVANLSQKELILASNTKKFFTEPHYNGYPAEGRDRQGPQDPAGGRLAHRRPRRAQVQAPLELWTLVFGLRSAVWG